MAKLYIISHKDGTFWVMQTGRKGWNCPVILKEDLQTYEAARDFVLLCERNPEFHWNQTPEARRTPMRNMSKYEVMVLDLLAHALHTESNVYTFRGLADVLRITERQAKTACRALKQRGYTEHTAYWTDDGLIGGSGYEVSMAGLNHAKYNAGFAAKLQKVVQERTKTSSRPEEQLAEV